MAYPFVKSEYCMSFTTNNRVKIGEYDVLLPDMPKKDKDFVNYDKPLSQQKWVRPIVPPDLKTVSPNAQEDFINRWFHKRLHGIWILIKDTPIHLAGKNWYYLSAWTCESGVYPEFRICDTKIWQWWRYEVVADFNCYGGLTLKSRRIGLTEINLCEIYEHATRVRNAHAGIQNMTDEDAEADFNRIVKAHNKMYWFFKPVNKGSNKPADGLVFEPSSEKMTKERIQREFGMDEQLEEDFQPLFSSITYEVTKLEKYDGRRLTRARQGEFGKIRPHVMDITKRMGVLAPCLHMYNGEKIAGKTWWESTSREVGEGEMLERTTQMWNDSNPTRLDANGRTKSGLKRLFLSALDTAKPDEYGFPTSIETKKRLESKFAFLEKSQDWQALSDAQREDPLTITHALTPSVDACLFNALKLKKRLEQCQNNLWWDNNTVNYKGEWVQDVRRRGNFYWERENFAVGFFDDPRGKFLVSSLLPPDLANKLDYTGYRAPGNKHMFGFGVDPIDTRNPEGTKQSSPAAALFRKPDLVIDRQWADANGKWVQPGNMSTGQFWLTYCHRPEEPKEFYEDMLMVAYYYGTEMLYERNKGAGIREHFKDRGYWNYLAFRPESTKGQYTTDLEPGLPATEGSIEQYIGSIATYVALFIDNCKHPELIHDGNVGWLTLRNNVKSRSKHDLAVASGLALLHAEQPHKQPDKEISNDEWFDKYQIMNATTY